MPNGDYRSFVKQGDAKDVAGLQQNRFNRAADWVDHSQNRQGFETPVSKNSNQILVYNDSGSVVPAGGVLGIAGLINNSTGVRITPSQNANILQNGPMLVGKEPTADYAGKFVIAQGPININGSGLAYFTGICMAMVNMAGGTDTFADVTPSDVTQLTSGGSGGVRILFSNGSTGMQTCLVQFSDAGIQQFKVASLPAAISGAVPPYVIANSYSNTSTGTANISVGIVVAHAVGDIFLARPCPPIMNSGSPLMDASNKSIGMIETGTYNTHFTTKIAWNRFDGGNFYDIQDPSGSTTLLADQDSEWSQSGSIQTSQASSGCCYINSSGAWVLSFPYETLTTSSCP